MQLGHVLVRPGVDGDDVVVADAVAVEDLLLADALDAPLDLPAVVEQAQGVLGSVPGLVAQWSAGGRRSDLQEVLVRVPGHVEVEPGISEHFGK